MTLINNQYLQHRFSAMAYEAMAFNRDRLICRACQEWNENLPAGSPAALQVSYVSSNEYRFYFSGIKDSYPLTETSIRQFEHDHEEIVNKALEYDVDTYLLHALIQSLDSFNQLAEAPSDQLQIFGIPELGLEDYFVVQRQAE